MKKSFKNIFLELRHLVDSGGRLGLWHGHLQMESGGRAINDVMGGMCIVKFKQCN